MGICTNKPETSSQPQIYPPEQSKQQQPAKPNNAQKLMPKASRILDIDYKQIPNKFRRVGSFKKKATIHFDLLEQEVWGLVGLTNLGNTCYINSSIQTLSNSQPLADYFQNQLHVKEINPDNPLSSKGEITQVFATLLRNMWARLSQGDPQLVIRPSTLISVVERYNPIFGSGSQEDAHEFIGYLLDMIHEDLNRIKKKPYVEVKTLTKWPVQADAEEAWFGYLSRNQSIIVDLFQGLMLNSLQCLTCQCARYKFEPFMYLSVPVPSQTCHLRDCIREFINTEILRYDEMWLCPHCGQARESQKKIDLWTLPNLLIIHLKRFKFTPTQRCKVRTMVNYPLTNLSFEDLVCVEQETKPTYDLYAVINHSGTLTGGHYTAFAKNRDDLKWYHYNDSLVSEASEQQVVSTDGYLLLYFKNSVEEFKRQTLDGNKVMQRKKTIKNTIFLKSQQIKDSHSQMSKEKPTVKNNQSVSSIEKKPILVRKQTKHFQKVKDDSNAYNSQAIIIEEA